MKKILVVGSLNMDFTVAVKNFPKPGETIFGKDLLITPGGKGANQAYAIGKLGGDIQMIGCVGKDDNGRTLRDSLSSVHVDVSGIRMLEGVPTGMALIMNEECGENTITVVSGANTELTPKLIEDQQSLLRGADVILTQMETPLETVAYLSAWCGANHKKFILDPSPARADLPEKILRNVDMMKPNETELSILTGMPVRTRNDISAAAERLVAQGVKNVVTTLGGKGTIWTSSEGSEYFVARKVCALDTTAAGDTFMAAMLCKLTDTWDFRKAIPYAAVAASIAVTRRGAQRSIPDKSEVEAVLGDGTLIIVST